MSELYPINEQLYRYFDGELTGSEKEAFEAELAASPELQESLKALSLSRYAVNHLGLLQQVSAIHAEFTGANQQQNSGAEPQPVAPVRKMNRFRYAAIAAAAAVVLFLGVYLLMPSGKQAATPGNLYASVYQPFKNDQLRGGASEELEQQYEQKNYKLVITLYNTLFKPAQKEKLLTAIAYMETGNFEQSVNLLLSVQQDNKITSAPLFAQDAEYFLGLAYLKLGKLTEAGEMFRNISSNPKHQYSDKITASFMEQFNKLKEKK